MAELMPNITELEIENITVGQRLRPVYPAGVSALLGVINDHGFTVPIIVRRTKAGWVLIDGAHRLAAMIDRGATSVPVRAYTCNDAEARTMEAAQNLAGISLSPLDDALFLAAYRTSYLEMHPETARGVAGGLARHGVATDLKSFAELIADKRSISKRHVTKLASAGRDITRDEANQLRMSPEKVTLDDILLIGKLTDTEERGAVIRKLAAGAAKSASIARRAYRTEIGAVEAAPATVKDADFTALVTVWKRASAEARKRFLLEMRHEVWEAQNKGASLLSMVRTPEAPDAA